MITSEWGTPKMVEDGLVGELLLGNKYGHKLHVWDLNKRNHVQEIDLGPEHQMVLELRPAHDPSKAYGFVGVVTSTADLTASVWLWERADDGTVSVSKVISIPAEPAEADQLPPLLQPFGAVPPLVTDISLSVDDQDLYVSCWGTGELKRFDVSDPREPRETGSVRLGGIVARAAHPASRAAQRRPADGRDLARRQAHLPHQLALRRLGRAVLPRGHRRLVRQARRGRGRLADRRPGRLRAVLRRAPAPGAAVRRRRLVGLVLLPGAVVSDAWPYILLGLLGAYHGLNPAMGWLFAVALGMQERSRRAVLRSLVPIAIGHEASIVLVAVLVVGLGLLADTHALHVGAGIALIAFGIFRFVRPRAHFRWTKLQRQPARAGLVVVPDVDRARRGADGRAGADRRRRRRPRRRPTTASSTCSGVLDAPLMGGLALLLHVASMMLVMAVVAVVVYEKLGVAILRQAWLNTEWLWAGAFVIAGLRDTLHLSAATSRLRAGADRPDGRAACRARSADPAVPGAERPGRTR